MKTVIAMLQLALALIPAIIEAVKAIEAAITVPKSGPEKMKLVLDAVLVAFDATKDIDLPKGVSLSTVESIIEKLTSLVVGTFNRLGIFKTSQQNLPLEGLR